MRGGDDNLTPASFVSKAPDGYRAGIFCRFMSLILLLLILGSAYQTSALLASSDKERDFQVERAIHLLQQSGVTSFRLKALLGSDWDRMCFQPPYQSQSTFEASSGLKISWLKYKRLENDSDFGLVLARDGNAVRVHYLNGMRSISRWPFDTRASACSESVDPVLQFLSKDHVNYFMFLKR